MELCKYIYPTKPPTCWFFSPLSLVNSHVSKFSKPTNYRSLPERRVSLAKRSMFVSMLTPHCVAICRAMPILVPSVSKATYNTSNTLIMSVNRIFGYTALSVCEYLATLEIEIRYVWARKVSLSTVLFLVNRYANICNTGLMMVQLAKWSRDKVESANRVSVQPLQEELCAHD